MVTRSHTRRQIRPDVWGRGGPAGSPPSLQSGSRGTAVGSIRAEARRSRAACPLMRRQSDGDANVASICVACVAGWIVKFTQHTPRTRGWLKLLSGDVRQVRQVRRVLHSKDPEPFLPCSPAAESIIYPTVVLSSDRIYVASSTWDDRWRRALQPWTSRLQIPYQIWDETYNNNAAYLRVPGLVAFHGRCKVSLRKPATGPIPAKTRGQLPPEGCYELQSRIRRLACMEPGRGGGNGVTARGRGL
jgi:hypothetical protein